MQWNIQISQGNAATDLWLGGRLCNTFFRSSSQNAKQAEGIIKINVHSHMLTGMDRLRVSVTGSQCTVTLY